MPIVLHTKLKYKNVKRRSDAEHIEGGWFWFRAMSGLCEKIIRSWAHLDERYRFVEWLENWKRFDATSALNLRVYIRNDQFGQETPLCNQTSTRWIIHIGYSSDAVGLGGIYWGETGSCLRFTSRALRTGRYKFVFEK